MGSDPVAYLDYLHKHCDCLAAELRPIHEQMIKELKEKVEHLESIIERNEKEKKELLEFVDNTIYFFEKVLASKIPDFISDMKVVKKRLGGSGE